MNDFGRLLQLYRTRAGRSCNQLARACHIDPSYISRIERGEREAPRPEHLRALIAALGLDAVEARDFALIAVGVPETRGWVDDLLHGATMRTANAILAGCPCAPCATQRARLDATG